MPMLTVRMTPALYQAFKELAYQRRQAMNAIAVELISKAVASDPHATAILMNTTAEECNECDSRNHQDDDPLRSPMP